MVKNDEIQPIPLSKEPCTNGPWQIPHLNRKIYVSIIINKEKSPRSNINGENWLFISLKMAKNAEIQPIPLSKEPYTIGPWRIALKMHVSIVINEEKSLKNEKWLNLKNLMMHSLIAHNQEMNISFVICQQKYSSSNRMATVCYFCNSG